MNTQAVDMESANRPQPYRWLAWATVAFTFVLICAGALVTGNEARLSDPEWPSFWGKPIPTKETFVGGARYEDAHRVIASVTGMLMIALAFWIQRRETRPYVRKLAWWGVAAVFAQALVGGAIIHVGKGTIQFNAEMTSVIHACLGQGFFMITIALAGFASVLWAQPASPIDREGNRSYRTTLRNTVILVYVQLLLGASVRHAQTAFLWHLGFHIAVAVTIVMFLIWIGLRTFGEYADIQVLRRGAVTLLSLALVQVILGTISIFANRARLEDGLSALHWILFSTAHVAVGALILATVLTMTLRARRLLAVPEPAAAVAAPEGQTA